MMDEITIRRERGFTPPIAVGTGKTERQTNTQSKPTVENTTGLEVSRTLRRLMSSIARETDQIQTDRTLLRTGESTLAEVEDILRRLGTLQEGEQAELEDLLKELDRVLSQAAFNGTDLFTTGDPQAAERLNDALLEALQKLVDKFSPGVSPDEALKELSGGVFTSFAELMSRLPSGTAEELLQFLTELMYAVYAELTNRLGRNIMMLLSGTSNDGSDLLTALLSVLNGSSNNITPDIIEQQLDTVQLGGFELKGRDLSHISLDNATNILTVGGESDIELRGAGHDIVLDSSGTVTLKNVQAERLIVSSEDAEINTVGRSVLRSVELRSGASLTLDGRGKLDVKSFDGDKTGRLSVKGGVLRVDGGTGTLEKLAEVTVSNIASMSAHSTAVRSPSGEPLEPVDLMLKALLPNATKILLLGVDGSWARLDQADGIRETVRLWLARETDPSNGHPVHTVTVIGKDENGKTIERGVYVQWEDRSHSFREVTQYPNPFEVTGGEEGTDWRYEEDCQTLRILTSQVTAIAGGTGVTAEGNDFSGRLIIQSHIGELCLTLGGVECRVKSGRAFELGRENHVTLLLADGTENIFESGAGFAGISIVDGASLIIDRERGEEDLPSGKLTAQGAAGGAGIGRDSGGSWDHVSCLEIRGGTIIALGGGAGAGLGAGKHGFFGSITITGGDITARSGTDGGAGIGGALGGPVGSITIKGGRVKAAASYHAAAIGAGIEGESGDILITGNARVLSAKGGDPGADIGACLFGGCGYVRVTGGADIGSASVSPRPHDASYLKVGGRRIAVPRFCVSSQALHLNGLKLETRSQVNVVRATAGDALRRVSRIRTAYGVLGGRLEEELRALRDARNSIDKAQLIRDASEAGEVLSDARRVLLQKSAETLRVQSEHTAEELMRLLR